MIRATEPPIWKVYTCSFQTSYNPFLHNTDTSQLHSSLGSIDTRLFTIFIIWTHCDADTLLCLFVVHINEV